MLATPCARYARVGEVMFSMEQERAEAAEGPLTVVGVVN